MNKFGFLLCFALLAGLASNKLAAADDTADRVKDVCTKNPPGNYADYVTNCKNYIACTAPGIGYLMPCPAGTSYSQSADRCEYSSSIFCKDTPWTPYAIAEEQAGTDDVATPAAILEGRKMM